MAQSPGVPTFHPPPGWNFDATTVSLFVLLAAFALGFTHLGRQAWDALSATRTRAATVDPQFKGAVLVVGASPKSRAAIQLTVSPRGHQPIFVSTGDEAISRLRENMGSFQVAVVDQSGARRNSSLARHSVPAAPSPRHRPARPHPLCRDRTIAPRRAVARAVVPE